MKVIVASFQYEACGMSSTFPGTGDFECAEGRDVYRKLDVEDVFRENGIETVPVFYANALPGGICPLAIYESFAEKILSGVREHADADGILLVCHGSSEIEKIGSGELDLVSKIRSVVGDRPLISVAFDLHANIHPRLIPMVDIVCGYKTAPHTDQRETHRAAAKILADALCGGNRPVVRMVKVPMLPAGDTMLTAEEPLRSLIAKTRAAEQNGIFRVNLFFSHMWVDAPNTCASVTVTAADARLADAAATDFANRFWQARKQFRFRVETGSVSECVRAALARTGGRVFLTDSGDNTTAGAEGDRTDILQELLRVGAGRKKICVSGITSPEIVEGTRGLRAGEEIEVPLPAGAVKGKIVRRGKILGWAKDVIGESVTVDVGGIDVIFTEKRSAFIAKENFELAGEDLETYEIVAVKQGYLFSELAPYCDKQYFVMSDGSSCVDIRRLGLKRIPRPLWPLDDFEWQAKI